MKTKTEGQTLLEFLIGSSVILFSITVGGSVLHAEWQRSRCAYITFERTHQALVGKPTFSMEVKFKDSSQGIKGEGKCGNIEEEVYFKKL